MPRRLASIDALRGLIMIIMALDHVRDFFHLDAALYQPEDLTRTTTLLFFTRWITHFCAPVFMFTAGIGAYFWLQRGRTPAQLSSYLLKRGLWLVLLELTFLRFAMTFSLFSGPVLLTVLWALGWSMVALAVLIHIPVRVLAPLSLAVIALHNLTDPLRLGWFWTILHRQQAIQFAGITVVIAYPLVPWIFVMSAGFCFGQIMNLEPAERRRWLVRIGLAATAAFIAIRALNVYGDPQPWTTRFAGMTWLSFLRATKYPPSLDFLLMTLGPAILLLAWFDRDLTKPNHPVIDIFIVYGRVPLFYFLGHFLLAHALTIPLAYIRYGHYPPDAGINLGAVYIVWAVVVLIMYPLCVWFAKLKQQRRDWWLSYL
jgi:uncharacterized membrane protein